MRHVLPLFAALALGAAGHAQERIAPPPPDPVPDVWPAAAAVPDDTLPAPVPRGPQSVPPPPPDVLGPYPPYPPPGAYPYPPPRAVYTDPANPGFWMGVDALVWWVKNQPVPSTLVTTGPAAAGADAGGLGVPGTVPLGGPINYGSLGGFQLFAGGWFTPAHTFGMDGSLFALSTRAAGWSVIDRSGTGAVVINEPVAGAPFFTQVSAPGVSTGVVSVVSTTRLVGGDLNLLYNAYRGDGWNLTLLGGFKALELRETLNVVADSGLFVTTTYTDNLGNVLASAGPGSSVTVADHFLTRNQFYGGQVGARLQFLGGRWSFDATGKLALGGVHQTVSVSGDTAVFPNGGSPVFLSGGNYATIQSGQYSANRFAAVPSLQLRLGYQFTPFLRGTIGYNFTYLSSVVRPGDQIDNTFDGVRHPLVPMTTSGYWAQGITLGLQFSF
jgi:hypothetical protein